MTQADRVLSTPPINAPTSRRRFLSVASTLAAGSAALALAIPPALATDDPIFVAIEAHKAAFARVIAAIDLEQAADGSWHNFLIRNLTEILPGLLRGNYRGGEYPQSRVGTVLAS